MKEFKRGEKRVVKNDLSIMLGIGVVVNAPYQVEEFAGCGLGWMPLSTHETREEAEAQGGLND